MKLMIDEYREINNPTSRDIEEAFKLFQTRLYLDLENSYGTTLEVTKTPDPNTVTINVTNFPGRSSRSPFATDMTVHHAVRYVKATMSTQLTPRNTVKLALTVFGLLLIFFTVNTFFDPVSQKVAPTFSDKLGVIGQVVLPLAAFAGYIVWIMLAMTRLRPKIARRLGNNLGVTIVEGRKLQWEIREKDLPRGCLVSILDLSITMLLVFCPFVIMVLGLIFARGGF